VKINLYREIEHKADLCYEIYAENTEELLKDVVDILLKNSEANNIDNALLNCLENFTKKCYNILSEKLTDNFSDAVFDAVNDIISLIDRGFYPFKIERLCIYFCKININLRIKALTYHRFVVEKKDAKIYARMVFDI